MIATFSFRTHCLIQCCNSTKSASKVLPANILGEQWRVPMQCGCHGLSEAWLQCGQVNPLGGLGSPCFLCILMQCSAPIMGTSTQTFGTTKMSSESRTGQEVPESHKRLHLDLFKKTMSGDWISGRKPYGYTTRMFSVVGSAWK